MISKANDIDTLRKIHTSYPEFKTEIQDLLIKRKEAIENSIQVAV